MRLFVTGGTGYIGGQLVRRLATEGHTLSCLIRESSSPERVEALRELGTAIHVGNLSDRESLRPGMQGVDRVIHAGAELNHDDAMDRSNVRGSDNIASLAVEMGIPRFLSVSSISYWGGSPVDGSPGTEESPVQSFPTVYSASKNAGEEAIRAWSERGLKVVTVYPSLVYGPPGKKNGANFFLYQMVHANMPVMIAGSRKVSWVHVGDVVDAMARIVDRDLSAGDYILAGEGETLMDTARRVADMAGVRAPRASLPVPAAKLALHALSPFFKLSGRRLPVEPVRLNYLSKHWYFSDQKAQRDLGWTPRGLDEGLPPAIEMLRERQIRFEREP